MSYSPYWNLLNRMVCHRPNYRVSMAAVAVAISAAERTRDCDRLRLSLMGGSPQSLRKPRHCFVVIREHAKRCSVSVRQRLSDESGSILLGKGQDRSSRRLNERPEAPYNVRDFHDCGRVYRRGRVTEITKEGESRLTTRVMVDPSEDIFPFRRVGIFARDCD